MSTKHSWALSTGITLYVPVQRIIQDPFWGFFCDWIKSPLFQLLILLLRFSILCYAVKNRQSNCIDLKEAIELMLTVTFSS